MKLDGRKGAFLWNVPASQRDCDELADFAESLKLEYLLIKVADGPNRYNDPDACDYMANAFRLEWFRQVGAWGYCYGTDGPEFGGALAGGAADIAADLVVVDWEPTEVIDWEEQRKQLFAVNRELVRAELKLPFVFCGLPEPSYHAQHPFDYAKDLGWYGLPMAYHNAMGLNPQVAIDTTLQQWGAYGWLPSELVMGAGAYNELTAAMRPGDVAKFAAAAFVAGCRSICYWSLDWLWLHRDSFLINEVTAVSVPPFIPDAEVGEAHPEVPAEDDRPPF